MMMSELNACVPRCDTFLFAALKADSEEKRGFYHGERRAFGRFLPPAIFTGNGGKT